MITLLAWIMLGAQISVASKPPRVPLSINISTSASTVPYGSPIVFKIKLANRTDHQIDCTSQGQDGVNITYAFEFTNFAGKKVLPQFGQMTEYGYSRCTLDPGAAKSWEQSMA